VPPDHSYDAATVNDKELERTVPSLDMTLSRPRRRTALLAAAAALAFAGCGDSGSGKGNAGGDPASIAPKTSVAFVEGKIRPDGAQKTAILDVVRKLGNVQDPAKLIQDTLTKQLAKNKVDYKKDIEPVLGDRAGVAITALGSGNATKTATIVAVKDEGKAKDLLIRTASGKLSKSSYNGVEVLSNSGSANQATTVKGFLVLGAPESVRAVIDASKSDGLGSVPAYKDVAAANQGKLAFGYLDLKGLLNGLGASGSLPAGQASALTATLGTQLQPVGLSLDVAKNAITFEASAQGQPKATQVQSSLLPELPGDSFVAIGIPTLGASIKQQIDQVGSGLGGGAVTAVEQQLKAQTGIDLNSALATVGDVALFARGDNPVTIGGGLVAAVSDAAAAKRLLAALAKLAVQQGKADRIKAQPTKVDGGEGYELTSPKLPGAVFAVVAGKKLLITYGRPALDAALRPASALGDAADYKSAVASLSGAVPALYVAFAPIAKLVAASSSTSNPKTAEVQRVLGQLTTLAAGGKAEGSRAIGRLVLALK
jgi:hypothetical protein